MIASSAQVNLLFATSLGVGTVAEPARLNGMLAAAIGARRPGIAGRAEMAQAWKFSEDLAIWGGEGAALLAGELRAAADRLTLDVGAREVPRYRWDVTMTAYVAQRGEVGETSKRHDAFWRALYFIDDGYAGDRNATGGELVIEDPRLPAPLMEDPDLRLRLQLQQGGAIYMEEAVLRPAAGRLLMLPGWLRVVHRPHNGKGERIWISADLVAHRLGGS
ncbi:hypothetical protein [Sphingomonas sanxanigenens]|uniref:Uncharacterized protein n=1 Tax=Sphingomonas sanxanigenens DSM 19645 = NX02 TaxID=1123269 RepID=W0AJX4_9SPHN|nr:hypothetical protein [Sphingomonas sanxanigenens]AHE56872.1 hypothetical protein NX02_26390 [Sphingomonas sanxanigenens DSM 19645 = NX02]